MGIKCVYLGTAGAGAGLFQGSSGLAGLGTMGIGVGFGLYQGSLLLDCQGSRTGSCPTGQGTGALLVALGSGAVAGFGRACRMLKRCTALG